MTTAVRGFYSYFFGFTCFAGKACFGLAGNMGA